jgi:hypothetical protein
MLTPFALEDLVRHHQFQLPADLEANLAILQRQQQMEDFIRDAMNRSPLTIDQQFLRQLETIQDQLRASSRADGPLKWSILSRSEDLRRGLAEVYRRLDSLSAIDRFLRYADRANANTQLGQVVTSIVNQLQLTKLSNFENVIRQSDLAALLSSVQHRGPAAVLQQLAAYADAERYEQSNVVVQSDGSVLVDGEIATGEEVREALAQLLSHPEGFLTDIASALSRYRQAVRKALLWFLDHLFGALLALLVTTLYMGLISPDRTDKSQIQREIRRQIRNIECGRGVPGDRCLVTGDGLRIRTRPRKNAAAIGLLPIGSPVVFVEKRGRWILIEHEAVIDGSTRRGWVYGT